MDKKQRIPKCDVKDCNNNAYREVYPSLLYKNSKKGWSFLCRKHFKAEQKRYNNKLPYCTLDKDYDEEMYNE